jgi:hypothetical protein
MSSPDDPSSQSSPHSCLPLKRPHDESPASSPAKSFAALLQRNLTNKVRIEHALNFSLYLRSSCYLHFSSDTFFHHRIVSQLSPISSQAANSSPPAKRFAAGSPSAASPAPKAVVKDAAFALSDRNAIALPQLSSRDNITSAREMNKVACLDLLCKFFRFFFFLFA